MSSVSAYDYAHQSVGFLTWHRLYLLWFEREMRLLDNTFTLRYWDWTKKDDRDILFQSNTLGGIGEDGMVESETFGQQNWMPVCWNGPDGKPAIRNVCDPTINSSDYILRCINKDRCHKDGAMWPTANHVMTALNIIHYRNSGTTPNKYDVDSFSNYLEGFDKNTTSCNKDTEYCGEENIPRRLHNIVSAHQ